MKIAHRLGLMVAVLLATLLALTATAVYSLALVGSLALAMVVALAGLLAMVGVAAAYAQARDAERQFADFATPEVPPPPMPLSRPGFTVREARPGEVPAPYLDAVRKGAEATRAAYRARERQH